MGWIPSCYDPIIQAEQREKDWDDHTIKLPLCALCRRRLYPGEHYREARNKPVCTSCFDQLAENKETVDVD